jgi:hypothetical protein
MNIKCSECGLVNWATEVECKRCKALLTVQDRRAEQLMAFEPEVRPFFSKGLTFLTGLLAFSVLSTIVSRVLGLEHSDAAKGVAILLMLSGLVLMLVTHIWMLVRIFEQSIGWGLGSLFVPFVGLIAVIKFWENTKRSFVGQLVCFGIMIFAAQISVAR